jgi:membrane protein
VYADTLAGMTEATPGRVRTAAGILAAAARRYGPDRAGRMAAAIAYRAVFAFAPLTIVTVGVAGLVLGGSEEAQRRLIAQVEELAGSRFADLFGDFLAPALDVGSITAIVGLILLLWFISSLFLEVHRDLDDIFRVPYEHVSGLVPLIRQRSVGAAWSFGLGLALLAVLLLNSLWRVLESVFPDNLLGFHAAITLLAPFVSLVLLPPLFGLLMQTMSTIKLPWRPVRWGATFISVAFLLTIYAVNWYFAIFGSPTAIGFASSLVIVLFMAFVLSSVFLFGAEVTAVLMERLGPVPGPDEPEASTLVAEPPTPAPKAAILGFLGGLVIGWWRGRD